MKYEREVLEFAFRVSVDKLLGDLLDKIVEKGPFLKSEIINIVAEISHTQVIDSPHVQSTLIGGGKLNDTTIAVA